MSESKVLSYLHTPHGSSGSSIKSSLSSGSTASTRSTGSSANYTDHEVERIKNCGNLFERRMFANQGILKEFFNKEPCLYNQMTYSNAARIYHCLKADLDENPILKSLKLQAKMEKGIKNSDSENKVTEVPRITYGNGQEKRNTLQLAFSTLKYQKVLEDLTLEVEFYNRYPEFKEDASLVSTVLLDYMMRKFQLRETLIDGEPLDNHDQLVTQIETQIHYNKTNFAAELAKNRIRSDALTVDALLPHDIREVDTHKAELPLYCWINPLKIDSNKLIEYLINQEDFQLVEFKKELDRKCFMIDPHCTNVLMFHYSLRNAILNHDLVKSSKLIVQDKSSCLAPHTILKLLSKKDDVIITNVGGGLLAAFIGCMMEEFEGKVYVYGRLDDDKYTELMAKFNQIGCAKYIKLMKEDFISSRYDDSRMDNAKIILINAPCSKSALMNPMEFLFEEGEDVKYLKDYTLDANNPTRIKKCVQDEQKIFKHAYRFARVRAIVYQTYSKNSVENEQLVRNSLDDFNASRKQSVFPYKISPPVIPLTVEDIQNEEVVRHLKYLQFKPSSKMNGCFIALLTRDKDAKMDKNTKKSENGSTILPKIKHEPATFQEKNGLKPRDKSPKKKIINIAINQRRKSLGAISKKMSTLGHNNLEYEIQQLQLNQHAKKKNKNDSTLMDNVPILNTDRRRSFDRITQIGKLDPKLEIDMTPNRSSTPNKLQTICDENQLINQTTSYERFKRT